MSNNIAIAFSTKDRVELSKQSLKPLLKQPCDLFWFDGSKTQQGQAFFESHQKTIPPEFMFSGVSGGSGPAIVFALTTMLNAHYRYDYIGLVENDCLLPKNWLKQTLEVIQRGADDGLPIGAASARTYEDRVLIQRDKYAVMHNLGAGAVVFHREAAELVLKTYRTQWTTENRMTFAQLVDEDIGGYWAFRGNENWLCADWRWDCVLAKHGFASLGATPSHVDMIGQVPSLADQGLALARKPVEGLRDDARFERYRERLNAIEKGDLQIQSSPLLQVDGSGGQMVFAHQIGALGGYYKGDWRLKDSIGFGPFAWRAGEALDCSVTVPVLGPCAFFISGGDTGGQIEIVAKRSGFHARPQLPPEGPQGMVVPVAVPVSVCYQDITMRPMTSGVTFYGVRCRDIQPYRTNFKFSHAVLPPL